MSENVWLFPTEKPERRKKRPFPRNANFAGNQLHYGAQRVGEVVEETGFEGIWASGLSVSLHLVRDSNEASWTQVLPEFMADATDDPRCDGLRKF